MSYETLLYVWDGFSFIIFLIILLSSLLDLHHFKSNFKLILISFTLSIGMFLFYREQSYLSQGNVYPVLTFFTYFSISVSQMLLITLIVSLYTKKEVRRAVYGMVLLYGLIVGFILALNSYYGTFLSTHILIGIIYAIPVVHLVLYIVKYDKRFYINVFFLQSTALLVVYILKSINIINNIETISFTSLNRNDIGYLTVINVITYTFIISYLLAKNIMVNKELEKHKLVIEGSLFQAIKLSEADSLTGLYNRRKIDKVIEDYYDINYNRNKTFSIVMIDVNNFKSINDSYGHTVGDKVLIFVGKVLKDVLRDIDIISRWGGDEFLLLLPNTNKEVANIVIKKITNYFANHKCSSIDDYISLSFGVSDNSMNITRENMLEMADQRMYDSKKVIENSGK